VHISAKQSNLNITTTTTTSKLWPCIYLASLWRYGTLEIMGSRSWPFGVTWRHRSHDHSTCSGRLPMGGPLRPCVYLAPLWRYGASNQKHVLRHTHTDTEWRTHTRTNRTTNLI